MRRFVHKIGVSLSHKIWRHQVSRRYFSIFFMQSSQEMLYNFSIRLNVQTKVRESQREIVQKHGPERTFEKRNNNIKYHAIAMNAIKTLKSKFFCTVLWFHLQCGHCHQCNHISIFIPITETCVSLSIKMEAKSWKGIIFLETSPSSK